MVFVVTAPARVATRASVQHDHNEDFVVPLALHPRGGAAVSLLFDGHGACADILTHHVLPLLAKRLLVGVVRDGAGWTPATVVDVFEATDKAMQRDAVWSRMFRASGSTATGIVADLVRGRVLLCNLGDSRTFLFDGMGHVVAHTLDHTPRDETEAARIETAGLHVLAGRVNGSLAVSRSFGDFKFKASGAVLATPDVQEHTVPATTGLCRLYALMMSDGMWLDSAAESLLCDAGRQLGTLRCVDVVTPVMLETICHRLVASWGSYRDDCSVSCVCVDERLGSNPT